MIAALWLASTGIAGLPPARELRGHRFLEAKVVDSPFIDPWIAFKQGGALLTAPRYRYPGTTEPTALNLGGIRETVALQVGTPWPIAVDARLEGQVTTGLDPDAAFYVGALGRYQAALGMSARIVHSERASTMLTGRVFGVRGGSAQLEPVRVVDALLEDREATLATVVDGDWADLALGQEAFTRAGLALALAHAVHRDLGLQVSVGGALGTATHDITLLEGSVQEVTTDGSFTGGLALDWTPPGVFGVLFEVANRWQNHGWVQAELRDRVVHRGALGIEGSYLSGDALQLGLGVTAFLPTAEDRAERLLGADLRATYFFPQRGGDAP